MLAVWAPKTMRLREGLVAQLQRLEEMGEGGRHGRIFAEPGTAGNGAFEIGTRLC